ncbi:MAG: ABC transporter permease [Armatimonadota bacterium]|nr:ABC transporter permease [Armatimonadota bacterium]MDR7533129.1 ABC transporter permease [Armatimonadota bacterium]MDR7536625.1 ABC transporter permease [Armatimonadota bacterium]
MVGRSPALLAPALLLLAGLFVLPLVLLAAIGVFPVRGGTIVWEAPNLAPPLRYVTDPFYLRITLRTVGMAATVTLACAVLGFPYAYVFTRMSPAWQTVLLVLVLSPILTGTVVRSYGWLVILGRRGLLNDLLRGLGIIDEPLRLLFTMQGVVIALAQVMLPFMVLPIISVLVRQNPSLYDAARGLGASRAQAIRHVVLPLSLPGILAGSALVFVLAFASFTTPALVGGGTFIILPTLIYQQTQQSLDWGILSAISLVLLGTSLVVVGLYTALVRRLGLGWAER